MIAEVGRFLTGLRRRFGASPTLTDLGRLAAFFAVVMIGASTARWLGATDLIHSTAYAVGASVLLAVGLFASTSGISLDQARSDATLVLLAVTVGVLAKTAIIAGLMWAVFRRPEMAILGVVVAQIDPLSVVAIRKRSRLSPRAQNILAAWSSFDDPITVLMTMYLAAWLFAGTAGGTLDTVSGTGSAPLQLLLNAALALVAYVLWRATGARRATGMHRRRWLILQRALLLVVAVVAVWRTLMLGLATTGLFFRPGLTTFLERATRIGFWLAALAVGLGITHGVGLRAGLVLGAAAFGSQVLVGYVLTVRLPRADRIDLALGHQNGITAIVLALLLEPRIPGTVAVVGPAVVVVNLLHGVTNGVWARLRRRAVQPSPVRSADHSVKAVA
ncbi:hypothetical protein [Krasilnikovia sp. MM14-A1259]|uniref:hypothetical protein n=1 Tax=Krasilnikovia sp. MM14-A1259 TaxID=3373539 RepID=UPI00380C7223